MRDIDSCMLDFVIAPLTKDSGVKTSSCFHSG